MWFSFPNNVSAISVELQNFVPEYTDDDGKEYFRAPEHFAPRILSLPGFGQGAPPDAPEDLPKADPKRDGAIGELTATSEAQKMELRAFREDMASAVARITALTHENSELKTALNAAEAKAEDLEMKLQDKADATPIPGAVPLKKAG